MTTIILNKNSYEVKNSSLRRILAVHEQVLDHDVCLSTLASEQTGENPHIPIIRTILLIVASHYYHSAERRFTSHRDVIVILQDRKRRIKVGKAPTGKY